MGPPLNARYLGLYGIASRVFWIFCALILMSVVCRRMGVWLGGCVIGLCRGCSVLA